jgi:hypothetical protein
MSGDLATARKPSGTMAFEYSAGTVHQDLNTRRSGAQATPASRRPVMVTALVAALLATLVLATLRHAQRVHSERRDTSSNSSASPLAPKQVSTAAETGTSTDPAALPAAASSAAEAPVQPRADATPAPAAPAAAAPLAAAPSPAQPDLSGTWRGGYVDASGKQLLRVITLSIGRVYNDGGIEGTLQYQSTSGVGECKLHPRGSSYSAAAQRLQLSPEGCSLHYPRELGVPVDFDGVNPRANTLTNGRIEAPTGDVIRVWLKRVRGV